MNEDISSTNIDIVFEKPHRNKYSQYLIKRELVKNGFVMGKFYLTNLPISFSVIKVQTDAHIYEFIKETMKTKVTEKNSNNSYLSDEIYQFKPDKNCRYIIPPIQFDIPEIFGLDQVERNVKMELNSNENRCVTLYGPEGCGKSLLMKKLSNTMDNKLFIWLDYNRYKDEKEYLGILFRNILKPSKPKVLCIEDCRYILSDEQKSNLFLKEIISLLDNPDIDLKLLIRICDKELLDSTNLLKRSTKIFVKIIDKKSRFELIKYLINKNTGCEKFEEGLENFSNRLNNFTASNIEMFVDKVHSAFKELTVEQLESCRRLEDFIPEELLKFFADSEPLHWNEIGGYENIKNQLKSEIENPIKNNRIPTKGVLFYGPPGCSKTMFARALATECSLNLISIKPSTVLRGYVGESEMLLKEILMRARASAPSILFIDEIDIIFPVKTSLTDNPVTLRMLNELVTFLDGVESDSEVIFVAATNFREKVEPALVRAGRIDSHIPVDLPDQIARESILKIVFTDKNFLVSKEVIESLSEIACKLNGKSGASIVNFGKRVKYFARYELPEELQFTLKEININMSHVNEVLMKF